MTIFMPDEKMVGCYDCKTVTDKYGDEYVVDPAKI